MTVSSPHLVLSAPADLGRYAAAVLELHAFRPEQIMFGGDAQLNVVAAALAQTNVLSAFVPHPEIFSDPTNLGRIESIFGIVGNDLAHKLTHVRFGPSSDLRVLKFAHNIYVKAEHALRNEVRVSGNLFATSQVIPASVQKVLQYQISPAPIGLGSLQPEVAELSEAFTVGDIETWPAGGELATTESTLAAHICSMEDKIELRSFSNFSKNLPYNFSDGTFRSKNSTKHRDYDNVPSKGTLASFIAVPFNMADPMSIIPDLIRTYATYPGPAEAGLKIAVLPYNTAHRRENLSCLVREISKIADRRNPTICNSQLWLAWVKERVPRSAFRLLFPVAITDNGDPERDWTEARLLQLGVQITRLGKAKPTSETQQARDLPPRYREFESLYGQRVVETRSVSKTEQIEAFAVASARSQNNSLLTTVVAAQPRLTGEAVLRMFGGAT